MFRLGFLIVLLGLSLLSVFEAPAYYLWLAAILVTEYPFIFIFITAVLMVCEVWIFRTRLTNIVVATIAFCFFFVPVIGAYSLAKKLEKDMTAGVKTKLNEDEPIFSFQRMITGRDIKQISPQPFTYASYAKEELSLDFYRTDAKGKRPCIIVVHGGSWKSGDNKQLPELNSYLANAGYHVAAINYRLAPEYKSPSAVQDVEAALNFLKLHSERLAVDTNNLVLLGRSAGAQIALLAAYTLEEPGLKGAIDFYGPADMVWGYSVPANPLVMDSRKVMEDYLGGTYGEKQQQYLSSSPIHFVSPVSVPTLIIHGEKDVLVAYEHSTRLEKKLNDNGVENYFLSIPWATHGFDYHVNGPGGQLSTFAVRVFLESVFVNQTSLSRDGIR